MFKYQFFWKKDNSEIKRRFRFFYLASLSFAIISSLTGPFWVIYFTQAGLNYFEISMLVIANNAITLGFEIPTGILADLWGRKISVIISLSLSGLASMGIFLGRTFPQFFLYFALSGIGATFMSGAYSAWFFDSLTEDTKEGEREINIEEFWGHLSSGQQIGNLFGFLLGTAVVSIFHMRTLWLIEGLGSFLIFFYVFIAGKEEKHKKQGISAKEYKNLIKEGASHLFKSKFLIFLVSGSLVWFLSTGILSLAWQPFFKSQGIDPKYFGIILSGYMILSIFVTRKAGTLSKKLGSNLRLLQWIGALCAALTFGLLFARGYQWILFVLYGAVYSLHDPIFQSHLNKYIPSPQRATTLSTYNMSISAVTILSMLIFGVISDKFSLSTSLVVSSIICFATVIIFKGVASLEKRVVIKIKKEVNIERRIDG